jgi:hypothetical protein
MRRLIALLLVALPALAETITLDDYVARLEHLRTTFSRDEARSLAQFDVDSPQGRFHADVPLLEAIANATRDDVQLRSRLNVTIDELRRATAIDHAPADPNLLKRVATEQEVPELAEGGEIPVTPKTTPLMERVARSIAAGWDWVIDKLGKLLDWIFDLLPTSVRRPGATGGMRWIVGALVAAIVLLVVFLAFEVRRRARRKSAAALDSSEPLGSNRDADPLSRGASEWERYAAQLAQTGRFREAIRAWFHAALVSCYSAGVLHYRKSRTNWEYIATLAPSLEWRPEFISLTRRFEREWYGADQSTIDAYDDCRQRARAVIENVRGAA